MGHASSSLRLRSDSWAAFPRSPRNWQAGDVTSVSVLATGRSRAGRRFAPTHELALLDRAATACGALPGAHRGLLVVSELAGPLGIPDLTALVGDLAAVRARLALPVDPLLNEVDAGVVAVAHPVVAKSRANIARTLGWPVETVQRRLPGLTRSGALLEVASDRYLRPRAIAPLGRIYAVEAKVRDWKAALHQARTYNVWADGYVLVMGPLAESSLVKLQAEVEADRGGLVVDNKWRRRPTVRQLPAARRLWASEHLIAALSIEDYHPSVAP